VSQEPGATSPEQVAKLLASSRLPLVYGLVESTLEAQREACRIAELAGGLLDVAQGGRALHEAFELVGLATSSLGEIKKRADVVVFWGVDPEIDHPGFVVRYTPPRPGRTLLCVDVGGATGPASVPERLPVEPDRELGALLVLKAVLMGRRVEAPPSPLLQGLRGLAGRLAAARYGVILARPRGPEETWALLTLVREGNRKTRLRLVPVRGGGNAQGAETVFTWQTGFPGAVSFTRGYPRYGPGEYSGDAVLERGDADLCLLVGCDPARHLSAGARQALARTRTVTIGGRRPDRGLFIEAAPFEATPGTVCRMDGILVRQPTRTTPQPTEASILGRIADLLTQKRLGERG
jgi:formylmethanofuran dehydrogenase subunit B